MAFISRLIVAFLGLVSSSVFALAPVQGYAVWFGGSPYTVASFDVNGCRQGISKFYGSGSPWISSVTFAQSTPSSGLCSGGFGQASIGPYGSASCPTNSTLVSGSCICNSGFKEQGDSCVPDNGCPDPGHVEGGSGDIYETTSKYPSNAVCLNGCKWSAGGLTPSVCANGKCYYWGPMTASGDTCTGDGGAPSTSDPEPDPVPPGDAQCVASGKCPGTVNGTKVCVPCSQKEGTTSESGSTSSESTDSTGAPSGSSGITSTQKETTANCSGGSCNVTTTTTTTAPDGSTTTTTETESKSQDAFCQLNPSHVVCKGEKEGTWGGACAGGFQCTGDAVQCAQAQAAWKAACFLDVGESDSDVVKGRQAMAADQSALRAQLGVDGAGESFTLSSLINTDPLFAAGGGCPADQQITLLGQSMTLSLSQWCSLLQTAGTILQAAAFLAAALIVFRRG